MSKELVKDRVIKYLIEDLLVPQDMIDTNAEMKVFDSMIKSDGYGESDFKL